ncbi:MAG TPA: molybdopterin-dependent oxidoreductase [Rhodocyclaceae bacterium]|nr:molybdopterin-dependent oxidoreductase [Rhodocyclaceae bacterium]
MPTEIKSTCCYCGVGCGVIIEADDKRIVGVRGDPGHPANFGRLCTKGASLHLTARPDYRLLQPEWRPQRGIPGRAMAWDDALDHAADRFADIIRRDGPDAVAFYISGQLLTEDYYVFNKLAKGLVGTNNIDTNSRLCMSSAVAGYKQTLGADAPPCCYDDIEAADLIFISGANPAVAHPIVYRRIEDARKANPSLRVIVADPRRSETAAAADLHLALKPGTDVALLNAMLHVLIAEGFIDRNYITAHTQGFEILEEIVAGYPPAAAAEICGLAVEDIVKAARWFGQAKGALSLYCQGLNQSIHGTDNNAALIHLHLATGQIGRVGAGPFSLTGQPNAMGGREVGGLSNLLSAHRDLENPRHRAEIAQLWGVPEVPAKPGKTAVELFHALKSGEIKAVWIACTNPAQSMPHQAAVRAGLEKAEFVVLQEAFCNTETADYADLLLPATTWGEKSGTVTNSERRISRVRPAVPAPGEARHDWEIAADFARHLGACLGRDDASRLFPYRSSEDIFNEHRESTRGRDLDITGLSYELLEASGPQQWPLPEGISRGTARLYGDGCFPTPNGKARFLPVVQGTTHDRPDIRTPISLISGRMRDQWHGMSRTGTVPRLFNLEDEPTIAMHPCDLRHRQIESGDLVRVFNQRGRIVVRAVEGEGLQRGRAWLPMHWGSRFMGTPGANALTPDAFDPHSFQPELKHAAVQIEKAGLSYPLAVVRRCADVGEALAVKERAQHLLADFPYAVLSLYGRSSPLVVLRAAAAEPLGEGRLREVDQVFGLGIQEGAILYADLRRHISKKAIAAEGRLVGVRLAGETRALAWLKEAMAEDGLDASLIRFALAPSAKPPANLPTRTIVCKCADVSDEQIEDELRRGSSLEELQGKLKCGTFCGSCLPEIKRMAGRANQPAAA